VNLRPPQGSDGEQPQHAHLSPNVGFYKTDATAAVEKACEDYVVIYVFLKNALHTKYGSVIANLNHRHPRKEKRSPNN
jgi:hypothetical protein